LQAVYKAYSVLYKLQYQRNVLGLLAA
jgi:hypothetical protein